MPEKYVNTGSATGACNKNGCKVNRVYSLCILIGYSYGTGLHR